MSYSVIDGLVFDPYAEATWSGTSEEASNALAMATNRIRHDSTQERLGLGSSNLVQRVHRVTCYVWPLTEV